MRTGSTILCVAALCCAACSSAARPEDQAPLVLLRVQPLIYAMTDTGVPLPTLVTLTNPGASFNGTIEARFAGGETGHAWRQSVTIGKGRFRFMLYPCLTANHPGSTLQVTVVDEAGRLQAQQVIPIRFQEDKRTIVSVTDKNRRFTTQDLRGRTAVVTCLHRTDTLPDQWFGYRGMAAVFWDTLQAQRLTKAQEAALTDWIRSGGRLILGAKRGDTTLQSPLPRLVPELTVRAPIEAVPGSSRMTLLDVAEFDCPEGEPFSEKRIGLGSVVLLRADFNSIGTWPKSKLERLVGMQNEAIAPKAEAMGRIRNHLCFWDPVSILKPTVASMGGYTIVGFGPILTMMMIYILLVSVVDYVVLKKFRKLPWTWLTFPVLIAIFALFAYFSFYKGELGPLVRYEIMFEDVARNGDARISTLSCIRNNSHRPIEFATDSSHAIALLPSAENYDPFRGRRGRRKAKHGFTEDERGSERSISIPGHIGSYEFFSEKWVRDGADLPFSGNLHLTPTGIEGEVINHTDAKIVKAFLFHNDQLYRLSGDLRVWTAPFSYGTGECEAFLTRHQRRYYQAQSKPLEFFVEYARHEPYLEKLKSEAYGRLRHVGGPHAADKSIFECADRDAGILVAFFRESTREGGIPVTRIKCIRQVIQIAQPDKAGTEQDKS